MLILRGYGRTFYQLGKRLNAGETAIDRCKPNQLNPVVLLNLLLFGASFGWLLVRGGYGPKESRA